MTPLVAAAAVAMGLVLGLLGGGGSILTVPILAFLAGQETKPAIATSLLVVAATSCFALARHAIAGRVRWRTGLLFGAVAMVGAYLGGRVAGFIPADGLMAAFVGVMLVTAVMMLRPRTAAAAPSSQARPSRIVVVGLGMGAVTGLVGAGGGFMIVPALTFFGGLGVKEAIATSLLVIVMNASSGLLGHLGHTQIDTSLAVGVVLCSIVGAFAGTSLSSRIPAAKLRQAFGGFVLVMAGLTAYLTWG